MPQPSVPETSWQRYNRGVLILFKAWLAMWICGLFASLAVALVKVFEGWIVVQVLTAIAALIAWIAVTPFTVSYFDDNNRASARETNILRNGVDTIGQRLNIDWDQESFATLSQLLAERKFDELRQLLKNETNQSWDEIDRSIEYWTETVALRKIAAILARLQYHDADARNADVFAS